MKSASSRAGSLLVIALAWGCSGSGDDDDDLGSGTPNCADPELASITGRNSGLEPMNFIVDGDASTLSPGESVTVPVSAATPHEYSFVFEDGLPACSEVSVSLAGCFDVPAECRRRLPTVAEAEPNDFLGDATYLGGWSGSSYELRLTGTCDASDDIDAFKQFGPYASFSTVLTWTPPTPQYICMYVPDADGDGTSLSNCGFNATPPPRQLPGFGETGDDFFFVVNCIASTPGTDYSALIRLH